MDNAGRKIDEDGIDTEFESELDKAMKEDVSVSETTAAPRYHSPFDTRGGERAVDRAVTPLDQAHRIFGRTQDLCSRIEALCAALIGGADEPVPVDRPEAHGLMGKMRRHGDDTDARIAFTNKRLEELEQIMLGHSDGTGHRLAASTR